MYKAKSTTQDSGGFPASSVAVEHLRRVDEWLDMLPPDIKPDLDDDSSELDKSDLVVLVRFYSAREVIYQPFLLQSHLHHNGEMTQSIVEMAQACMEGVVSIYTLQDKTSRDPLPQQRYYCNHGHTPNDPGLERRLTSYGTSPFAVVIVLTIASRISHMIASRMEVTRIQSTSIRALQRLSFSGSCIKSMLGIEIAEHKTQDSYSNEYITQQDSRHIIDTFEDGLRANAKRGLLTEALYS